MANILILVVCFTLGIVLRRTGRLPADAHRTLNAFVMNLALPALILLRVHELSFDPGLVMPVMMPWVMFVCGALFFAALGRVAGWSNQTIGGLTLSCALANTSFMGLPMIEAFYGREYLGVGILVDQLGTYLVLSTAGVAVAMYYAASGRLTLATLARKVVTFAPFQAVVLALLLSAVQYPDALTSVLDRVGGTLTPVALVSVGYQMRLSELSGNRIKLGAGLAFKLAFGPALIALLFVIGCHAEGKIIQVTVFEAAMGPQIGGAIIAMDHGLDARLVGLLVGVGIPLSIATAAIWSSVMAGV